MSFPIATTIEAASSALMIVGCVFAVGRFSARVDENTKATERLTAAYDKHSEKVDEKLADHEVRITVLEKKK